MQLKTKWTTRKIKDHQQDFAPANELVEFKDKALHIRRIYPAKHQSEYLVVSFDNFWLPATPFSDFPTRLSERSDVMLSIAKCAEVYARRNSITKSTPRRISSVVFTLVKFFEYGWLNGAYSLADWTPQLCLRLFEDLKLGGWANALGIVDRATVLFRNNRDAATACLKLTDPKRGPYLKDSVRAILGTNLFGSALRDVRLMLLAETKNFSDIQKINSQIQRSPSPKEAGMSAGMLISETIFINLLGDLAPPYGLSFSPIPFARLRAIKEARGQGRTPTLRPEEVAVLMVDAHRWVYVVAPQLIRLFEQLVTSIELNQHSRTKDVWTLCRQVLEKSEVKFSLERILDVRIAGIKNGKNDPDEIGFKPLIEKVQTACFIIIGLLNARRRDEILHPVLGLQRASMRCVDERIELYQCDFYVEKTYKARLPFFVSKFTSDAINTLELISDLSRRLRGVAPGTLSERDGELSLFEGPHFRIIEPRKPLWYSFERCKQMQTRFPHPKLGAGPKLLRPHMFRRAYALLHHYRYENGDLLSLADQLGHLDLESVQIYVTDGRITTDGEADIESYARLTSEQRLAIKHDIDDLLSSINVVGQERVIQIVESVLAGSQQYSGGFEKLVTRLHQRLGRRLEYKLASSDVQQKSLGKFLVERGHVFSPFFHGNCVAAPNRPNRGAGCHSIETGSIDRAKAAPLVCAKCPYHVVSSGHLLSLYRESKKLEDEILFSGSESVQGHQRSIELENLKRTILLHEARLGIGKGN